MPQMFWFIFTGLIILLALVYILGLRAKIKSLQNMLDAILAENLELKLSDEEIRKKYPLLTGHELIYNAKTNKKREE